MLKLISAIILAVIFIGYAVYKKESIVKTWNNTVDGFKYMLSKMKELGFLGTLKIIFDDIFKNRTVGQWIYLLILGFSFLRVSFNFDLNLFSFILQPKGFFFISSLTIFSLFFG